MIVVLSPSDSGKGIGRGRATSRAGSLVVGFVRSFIARSTMRKSAIAVQEFTAAGDRGYNEQ